MIESGKYKGTKKLFPAEIITKIEKPKDFKINGITLKSRKNPLLTTCITLLVAILFSSEVIQNGIETSFTREHLVMLCFIYGITFIIITIKYLLNRPTK